MSLWPATMEHQTQSGCHLDPPQNQEVPATPYLSLTRVTPS
jgi:hypothetical protein